MKRGPGVEPRACFAKTTGFYRKREAGEKEPKLGVERFRVEGWELG